MSNTRKQNHLLRSPLLLALVVVVGSVTLLFVTQATREQVVANHLGKQLDQTAEANIPATLRSIANLDRTGIPILVAALNSNRQPVALGAEEALLDQIESWRLAGSPYWSPRLMLLCSNLAEQVDEFNPLAQDAGLRLVQHILAWPTDDQQVDRMQFLAACDHVMDVAPGLETTPTSTVASVPRTLPSKDNRSRDLESASNMAQDIDQWATLPGGDLPIEVAKIATLPYGPVETSVTSPIDPKQPRSMNFPERARSIDASEEDGEPKRLPSMRPAGPTLRNLPRESDSDSSKSNSFQNDKPASQASHLQKDTRFRKPSANNNAQPSQAPVKEKTLAVIRRLDDSDPQVTEKAKAELRLRKFTEREIALAMELSSPDVYIRRDLAKTLPHRSKINASNWLWWLTEDADAQVRLTAYRWLATSDDKKTLRKLHSVARQDRDLKIRAFASELLEFAR